MSANAFPVLASGSKRADIMHVDRDIRWRRRGLVSKFAVFVLTPQVESADSLVGVRGFTRGLGHLNVFTFTLLGSFCLGWWAGLRLLLLCQMAIVLMVTTASAEVVRSARSVKERSSVATPIVVILHGVLLLRHHELL